MTGTRDGTVDQVRQIEYVETDVLVIGGGISGHRAALAAHERGASVLMLYLARGASPYMIGCNAPIGHADGRDNPSVYFDDMVRGGYGLNDRRLVAAMCDNMNSSYWELAGLGVPFAADGERVLQRRLSGNAFPRSVYVPEGVGLAILKALGQRVQSLAIQALAGWKAIALLEDDGEVVGAMATQRHGDRVICVRAGSVVLANGGIGKLYDDSTYPVDVLSGSYALGFSAGARLVDMEFVQFEPVVTVWPDGCRGMEMPTAMLGDGARLINVNGERFMLRYNPDGAEVGVEKAKLSMIIQQEIDEGRGLPDGTVIFDTTHVPSKLLEGYVSHCRRLRSSGVDPRETAPRVRPAAHSQMGGIFIDEQGWTGVPGLYAGGEASGGVHGASRIAGNGCSDTVVFGALAGRGAAAGMLDVAGRDWHRIVRIALRPIEAVRDDKGGMSAADVKRALRATMVKHVGIWRNKDGLEAALRELRSQRSQLGVRGEPSWNEVVEVFETKQVLSIAEMISYAALARTESRGAHQRRDHRAQDDDHWLKHIAFAKASDGPYRSAYLPLH
jgi:succinate dehydrogenase/fumarate reductase flavoprotein subunit